MRSVLKISLLLALLPTSLFAVELRDDLPFVDGRYATEKDCKFLQAFEAKGEGPTLNNAAWHLTSQGFSDGWEQSCWFHAVFIRGNTATAQSICVAGADTVLKNFLLERQDQPAEHPDIIVFEEAGAVGADTQGTQYSWCPSGEPAQ